MELTDMVTLRLIQEKICVKVSSFRDWDSFIDWVKGITAAKFKLFVVNCLNDTVDEGNSQEADFLEIKARFDGT